MAIAASAAARGEPWFIPFEPVELSELLHDRGFGVVDDLGLADIRDRLAGSPAHGAIRRASEVGFPPGRPMAVARKWKIPEADQPDLPCPVLSAKTLRWRRRANQGHWLGVLSQRGALANVINEGRDAVDAEGATDESA